MTSNSLYDYARANIWLGILLLLIFLDVLILPSPVVAAGVQDTIGTSAYITFIWSIGVPGQIFCAILLTLFSWLANIVFVKYVARAAPTGARARGFVVVLALSGYLLRICAKRTLHHDFKYRIAAPDELITTMPYNWLLHPGYTGLLLHMCGVAVLSTDSMNIYLGSFCAALLMSGFMASLWVRITEEEEMLAAQFGAAWVAHTADRWHLLPGVW